MAGPIDRPASLAVTVLSILTALLLLAVPIHAQSAKPAAPVLQLTELFPAAKPDRLGIVTLRLLCPDMSPKSMDVTLTSRRQAPETLLPTLPCRAPGIEWTFSDGSTDVARGRTTCAGPLTDNTPWVLEGSLDAQGRLFHLHCMPPSHSYYPLPPNAKGALVWGWHHLPTLGDVPMMSSMKSFAQAEAQQKEDQKGFFQKYWIYIVPVVVMLLISGGAEEEKPKK